MPPTVRTQDLCAFHPEPPVLPPHDGSRNTLKEGWPSTSARELGSGLVQRGIAAGAVVDSGRRFVVVVFSASGGLSPFFAENPKLLGRECGTPFVRRLLDRESGGGGGGGGHVGAHRGGKDVTGGVGGDNGTDASVP